MDDVARTVAPAQTVVQDPPLGTGDAVRGALGALEGRLAPQGVVDQVLVLYGDTPFYAASAGAVLAGAEGGTATVILAGMRPPIPLLTAGLVRLTGASTDRRGR